MELLCLLPDPPSASLTPHSEELLDVFVPAVMFTVDCQHALSVFVCSCAYVCVRMHTGMFSSMTKGPGFCMTTVRGKD